MTVMIRKTVCTVFESRHRSKTLTKVFLSLNL